MKKGTHLRRIPKNELPRHVSKKSTQSKSHKIKKKISNDKDLFKNIFDGETPAEMQARMLAKNIENIQRQLATGKPLTAPQKRDIELYVQSSAKPAPVDPVHSASAPTTDDGPPDVNAPGYSDVARHLGLHYNTFADWKRKGIVASGPGPFSMKDVCVALHRSRKLRQCRPAHQGVAEIQAWILQDSGSSDPDQPDHQAPDSWEGEISRQNALRTLEQRRHEQIKVAREEGDLVPAEQVRDALHVLRDQASGALNSSLTVIAACKSLTIEQQIELSTALQSWVTATKERLSTQAGTYAKHLRNPDATG